MGYFTYDLTGNTSPFIKKFVIGGTIDVAGQLIEGAAADEAGVTEPATTGSTDVVGINLDTATYVTAQQTDGTSASRSVSIVINPLAVYAFHISDGATAGTAMNLRTVTTASTTGLTITTGDDWSSPQFDEGAIWCYSGANAGQIRKITSTGTTACTVTVPFDSDTAVGDTFLRLNLWPGDVAADNMNTTSTGIDARDDIAVATGLSVNAVEIVAGDISNDGRNTSYVYVASNDHLYNTTT